MEFVVDVVALQPLEKVQQRVAEYRPRPSFGICGILRDAVFDVVADTLEQRVEQVFLIFEMPIERAARYAGGLGDFVERGARNPFAVKGFQGGKHQVFFGFQGFGFGFSHNGGFVPARFDGWDYKKDLVSVQSCMYNNTPEIETISQQRSAEPTCFATRLNTGMPKQAVLYFETGIFVKSKII